MTNLSPIVLFVYNRPEHTKRTAESLLKNTLVDKSLLYIFSDGAKNEEDERKVNAVRNYIKAVKGFGKIEIVLRDKNFGLANSVILGITEVFKQNDRVIVIEDDLIFSPSFLSFINKALAFYQEDKSIYSISGYPYPIKIPTTYKKDVFISYRNLPGAGEPGRTDGKKQIGQFQILINLFQIRNRKNYLIEREKISSQC